MVLIETKSVDVVLLITTILYVGKVLIGFPTYATRHQRKMRE